ncbi:sensor histidine kinase [Clostridium aminobutyricum]|uniref:Sensor histidine kinase n=2 Tax=Clostridium aminobutyricum TaxID=33953 RepID=A0A939D982_CLOAM|nr:sensor histidine kinase [Clostridium aminobutyricum]
MELAGWSLAQKGSLRLDGEWEFYWGELLTPADFAKQGADRPKPTGYMQVPGLWNGKIMDGETLPAFGCATYRLVLKNLTYDGTLGVKKGNARFSSKVYVNGRELLSDGVPAQQAAEYKSGNTPQLGFFNSNGGDIEILVQVANYEYINSGIPVSFELGREAAMLHQNQRIYSLSLAVFVILITIAFLYFIFFAVARWNGMNEYLMPLFSLFCILFSVGNGLSDQRPLLLLLPDIPFTWAFKMKDFFLTANFIVVIWVFHLFKKELLPMRRLIFIISFVYGVYLIGVLFLPIHVYMKVHLLVMACNTVTLLLLLIRSVLMYIRKAEGFSLFIAILTVNLYSADAILFSLGFKTSSSFSQVYIMLFATVMMFLLSMQYFTAIRRLQTSMKRTQEAEISFLRAQINPHFLYNALNSIAALCATAPEKAEDVVVELSQYLRRSFDFKRMDAMSTLAQELELLEAYLYIEKMRFGERLQVEYDMDETLNLPIPPLILQPLVENAVRHGLMEHIAGVMVTISIKRQQDEAIFTIADNGVGMNAERLSGLLEQKPKSGGIGVWNINQRLKMLYNRELTVYSEKGKGTSVTFALPLHQEKKSGRRSRRKETT